MPDETPKPETPVDEEARKEDDLLASAMTILGSDRPKDIMFRACPVCGFFLGATEGRACPEHGQAVDLASLSMECRRKASLSLVNQILKVIEVKKGDLRKAYRQAKKQTKMLRSQTRQPGFRAIIPEVNLKPILAQLNEIEHQCRILQAQALSNICGEAAPPQE